MGGVGSTRWGTYSKKIKVESCFKFPISTLKSSLKPGAIGIVRWIRLDREIGKVGYQVTGSVLPEAIQLFYTFKDSMSGDEYRLNYTIRLEPYHTPWGFTRFRFICPMVLDGQKCGRRADVLYLPPGEPYFGCRRCHNLTYASCQDQHANDGFYRWVAGQLQRSSKERQIVERNLFPDPYPGYLTAVQLCTLSGLSPIDLLSLEKARLLLPDHDGNYRPKLVGWARKLAFLLTEGWEVNEIKLWAKGRWSTPDPRQWPPDKTLWKEDGIMN